MSGELTESSTAADLLGIEISDARLESMDALDADGLTALLGALREVRRWPGGSVTPEAQNAVLAGS